MRFIFKAGRMAAFAALLLAPNLAASEDIKAGDLLIQHAWARATPNGASVAGGYLTITNRGAAADTLTGGSAEVAAGFELHDMTMENGVMRMRPSGPLTIPPGGSVMLSPGGRHIMLTGLKRGLKKGDTIEGTLTFAHAGTVPVSFGVEGIGAREPAQHEEPDMRSGHDMPGMKM